MTDRIICFYYCNEERNIGKKTINNICYSNNYICYNSTSNLYRINKEIIE